MLSSRLSRVGVYAYGMAACDDVRSARVAGGLSIRELAERAEVAASTVWRIEAGRLDPTVGMLERLLQAADVSARAVPAGREATVSLALGQLTASELLRDPVPVLARAQQRVAKTLRNPDLAGQARRWSLEWQRLLGRPLETIVAALIDPSERGYELRQNTPFTGLLSDEVRTHAVRRASRAHRATRSA
jgi:transcriptional regulator with XRE-family HTH domain